MELKYSQGNLPEQGGVAWLIDAAPVGFAAPTAGVGKRGFQGIATCCAAFG